MTTGSIGSVIADSGIALLLAISVMSAACESQQPLLNPSALAVGDEIATASQNQEGCVNVSAEGVAALGIVMLPNGTAGFGGVWTPVVLGGLSGELASVVTSEEVSGEQGARHLRALREFPH